MDGAIKKIVEELDFPWPKPEQLETVRHLVSSNHCLTVLPTGYGKSLCYYLPPLIQNIVSRTLLLLAGTIHLLSECGGYISK